MPLRDKLRTVSTRRAGSTIREPGTAEIHDAQTQPKLLCCCCRMKINTVLCTKFSQHRHAKSLLLPASCCAFTQELRLGLLHAFVGGL